MTSSNKQALLRRYSIAGMTLLELLVTLLVLTMGIAALMKFQSGSYYYSSLSKQRSEALNLAKAKIESLRTYETLATTSGKVAYNDITSGTETNSVNTTTYTTTTTVTASTNPDYKTVNVVVSWTDRRGTAQTVSLSSIIGKIDPAASGVIVYD